MAYHIDYPRAGNFKACACAGRCVQYLFPHDAQMVASESCTVCTVKHRFVFYVGWDVLYKGTVKTSSVNSLCLVERLRRGFFRRPEKRANAHSFCLSAKMVSAS